MDELFVAFAPWSAAGYTLATYADDDREARIRDIEANVARDLAALGEPIKASIPGCNAEKREEILEQRIALLAWLNERKSARYSEMLASDLPGLWRIKTLLRCDWFTASVNKGYRVTDRGKAKLRRVRDDSTKSVLCAARQPTNAGLSTAAAWVLPQAGPDPGEGNGVGPQTERAGNACAAG